MATTVTSTKAGIFISYKRNVEPDNSLAARVFESLQQGGHDVFIDRTLTIGQEWAKEIEAKLRRSDFLIVFLTAASSASEMVKSEVQIARDQATISGKGPRILPVRLAFTGSLPYPLSAWLDPLQYALWRGEGDTDRVIRELVGAVAGAELSAPPMSSGTPVLRECPPLYAAHLPPPGGALDIDDPWYIPRISDDHAIRTISQQGVTLAVKGSRQMGKTSLLVRILNAAIEMGKKCVFVDFQMFGHESPANSSTFFCRFGRVIGEGLDVQMDAAAYWNSNFADSQSLTAYVEKYILQAIDAPIVLAIDEADILFQADFLYDFFGMLRSWHNLRATPLKKKLWKRLDLVLVTSTEPYLFIDRDHESPFNVAEVVSLTDFEIGDVRKLNVLHQSPLFDSEVDRLYNLLHGQPYLTRKALYVVKSGMTPDQLFAQAAEDGGPFGDHLRNYFLRLLKYPEIASALKQIALGRGCADQRIVYRLESAGLVRSEARKTVPRCSLYAEYFGDRL